MTEEKVNNSIDTDPDPSPNPGATKLRNYWTKGAGAAKIKWGVPGDFNRCVSHLRKYVSDPKGLCNVYHRTAVGAPPGKGHGKDLGEETEVKKDYSSDQREALGKRGHAFRNGNGEWSYPIANEQDLRNAIQAFGRAAEGDRSRLKAYIRKRARELGKTDLIPDGWGEKSIKLNEVLEYAQSLVDLDMSKHIFGSDIEEGN